MDYDTPAEINSTNSEWTNQASSIKKFSQKVHVCGVQESLSEFKIFMREG